MGMMTIQEAIERIRKEIRAKKREWVKIRYGTLDDYENTERIRDLEAARRILREYLKEEKEGGDTMKDKKEMGKMMKKMPMMKEEKKEPKKPMPMKKKGGK